MRKGRLLGSLTLILTCITSQAHAQGEAGAIPPDFRLVAEYGPGFSPWKPWTLTITRDGAALQETYVFHTGTESIITKSFKLTKEDVKHLVKLVSESRFFLLAEKYSYEVTDSPTLVLRVTMNRASHEVVVYSPGDLRGNNEVEGFLTVWNEVLRKVPPPNVEQRAQRFIIFSDS